MIDDTTPDLGETSPDDAAASGLRAGISAMLIGAVLVGVGVIATTSASDQPSCPERTTAIASFDLVEGVYLPSGTGSPGQSPVVINDGTATGGTWTSSQRSWRP